MAEQPNRVSFWQTMPGILTGVAALLTAVTGLVVGVIQTGIFKSPPAVVKSNTQTTGQSKAEPPESTASARSVSQPIQRPTPNGETLDILAADNGGKVIWATSEGWSRINIGPNAYETVGGHNPEEAVFGFRGDHAAVLEVCRYLVRVVSPSNVRKFELQASNESPRGPFQPIGQFNVINSIFPNNPYQEFSLNSTRAKYLKIRLLTNQNGYDNPFELREIQILGHLEKD